MTERNPSFRSSEIPHSPFAAYGAVPLDPWNARYPGTEKQYITGAVDAANYSLRRGISAAYDSGLFGNAHSSVARERATAAYAFVEPILAHFETQRVLANAGKESLFSGAELYAHPEISKAFQGTASPDQLLRLIQYRPELGSLELAKQTHPFNQNALHSMQEVMAGAIHSGGGELMEGTDVTYKLMSIHQDPAFPALVMLRKQAVGKVHTAGIAIMERRILLAMDIPDDDENDEVRRLGRLVMNPDRFKDCAYQVEDVQRNPGWYLRGNRFQPLATSLYAVSPCAQRKDPRTVTGPKVIIPESHYNTTR